MARGGQLPTGAARRESAPIAHPLRAHSSNHNYFADDSGNAVYLTGSHTWNDFQDWGTDDSPQPFDFAAYVKMLVSHHHNFTLLWQTELPTFRGWIVSQEAPAGSTWWNNHLITLTRACESGKRLQHPIGYGVLADNNDATIMNSDADWIAPTARIPPTRSCGSGQPACKVNINDSDHSYFGMWNDSAQVNRNFFWINFTQGNQTLFMDPYVVFYPREKRNLCSSPVHGIGSGPDRRWDNVRDNMGYIRGYADRMNLAATAPRGDLSNTGHALVSAASPHPEFLVYAPSGENITVNLSGVGGLLSVEWMNPATGVKTASASVSGGSTLTFTPPFSGDAALYLSGTASGAAQK